MKVIDIGGVHEANSIGEIEMILKKRHGTVMNSFWLSQETSEYPKLSVLVNGDLATLLYIPSEGHPGFRSVGAVSDLEAGGTTTFSISNNRADDVNVLNEAVIPFSVALTVAAEFLTSAGMPTSAQWYEL